VFIVLFGSDTGYSVNQERQSKLFDNFCEACFTAYFKQCALFWWLFCRDTTLLLDDEKQSVPLIRCFKCTVFVAH